jgi:hypothetical protein
LLISAFAGTGSLTDAGAVQGVIQTLQTNAPQWRKTINSVNVEDLPVAYATGKAYDQGKQIVNEDLRVLMLWAGRLAQGNSLYDQINYLSSMQEMQTQLQLLTGLLQDFSVRDKATTAKVQDRATGLSNMANGPWKRSLKPHSTIQLITP